jgi:FlaA1/EpsC-like NDP-sugar epimerase
MDTFLDVTQVVLCILAFAAPLIIMPCIWKFIDGSKMIRIVIGILLSAVCSFVLFCICEAIGSRPGMGP